MFAGRSIALPVWVCPDRGRDSARRTVELASELEPGPKALDEIRDDAPERDDESEDDPPELALDPLRDEADPDLPLEDEDGVREAVGISTTRAGSGALDPDDPEEPDEPPDELDPPAGRGIAWANEAAGTASASARAATTSERGFLSMTMHSFNVR